MVDYYTADVESAQDYYPFGMLQPGRSYNAGGYRYGFNGKENDNEVKGEGNQQDYGMRVYDPRVGRFLSVDPITKAYPELTPYQFASNRPIDGIDLDGKEWSKNETFDYTTGQSSIHFHCKIKVFNESSISKDALNEIVDLFKSTFVSAFSGLYDEKKKIRYSASADIDVMTDKSEFESAIGLKMRLNQGIRGSGGAIAGGNTPGAGSQNNASNAVTEYRIWNQPGKIYKRTPILVVISMLHEIGHTGGLIHPFDEYPEHPTQISPFSIPYPVASDMDLVVDYFLTKNYKNVFSLAPGVKFDDVVNNAMMYTFIIVNGKKISEWMNNDFTTLKKFTIGQAKIIGQQIDKDTKGESSVYVPSNTNDDGSSKKSNSEMGSY